jgi:hypothetical protein
MLRIAGNPHQKNKEEMEMKKYTVCLLACGLLVFGAFAETGFSQTLYRAPTVAAPSPTKTLQMEALKTFQPALFPETIAYGNLQDVNPPTGEVWLTAMKGRPKFLDQWPSVGFRSSGLTNTGTTNWTGVTITVTFQILTLQGAVFLKADVDSLEGNVTTAGGIGTARIVYSPGTYEVTSGVFAMKPKGIYKGHGSLAPDSNSAPLNQPVGCYAKITSIKFNFP